MSVVTTKSLYHYLRPRMHPIAREVIKRVGRRAYRYRVESYRDPETRKVRSRWTYLGVATGGEGASSPAAAPIARRDPNDTRERLVLAFERLVERLPYRAVTAGMVTAEAGLAHGTFYRYFGGKKAVFLVALDRKREEIQAARPSFDPPYGSLAEERARVRAWTEAVLLLPPSNLGVVRALYEVLEGDDELRATRKKVTEERVSAFVRYLEGLAEAKIIDVPEALPLATALFAMMDAVFRAAATSGVPDAAAVAGVVAVFDRAIFNANR